MGQQMMIIALLSSFLLSAGILGMMGVWGQSDDIAASQFESEQALNIAASGINMATSRLRQDKTWRTGFSKLSVADGGLLNVRIVDLGTDSVRVTSVATYYGTTHTSVADVEMSSIFPTVESALTIYGDSVNFTNSGKSFNIDGRDHNPDGTFGTHDPVSGIGVDNSGIQKSLVDQLVSGSITPNVVGKGGNGSVGTTITTQSDLLELRNFYKNIRTKTLAPGKYSGDAVYGTLNSPEILYVPGDLEWTGTVSGAGILVVDGALLMAGKVNWTGIIIAVSGDVNLELGSSGTPTLMGTTLIGSSVSNVTKVHVNGNPQIKYSHSAIETVLAKLSLLRINIFNYYE